ncbi:hypothetical protein HK103_004891 [Boothiomyces macroporosus]|uniref:Uroporphyrinogen decarboxylase (URO-D) domain-containing protein n=1 Tax=Boothiomyces macroporosus TaxID=261099 RepID=A0AAD5Y806_9FUNG|nr:hypothetical protein HK103_004891 [Boothiomyces macroporosus]
MTEECKARDLNEYYRVSQDPELCAKATLVPAIKYKNKLDGVLMFYDPMMIPQAMGMKVELSAMGPVLKEPIVTPEDLTRLPSQEYDADELFGYIMESIMKARAGLNGEAILIGNVEGPYTIMCTMIEGRACKKSAKAEDWLRNRSVESHILLHRIINFQIGYMLDQIRMGCQTLHIHEPNAEGMPKDLFEEFLYPFIIQLIVGAKNRLDDIGFRCMMSVYIGTDHFVFDRMCYTAAEAIQTPAWYDEQEKRQISKGKTILAYYNASQLAGLSKNEIDQKVKTMFKEYQTEKLVAHIYHDMDTDNDPEAIGHFLDSIVSLN